MRFARRLFVRCSVSLSIAASLALAGEAAVAQYRYGETEMYFAENFDHDKLSNDGSIAENSAEIVSVSLDANGNSEASVEAPNFIAARFQAKMAEYKTTWAALPDLKVPVGPALSVGSSGLRVAALRTRLGLPAGDAFDAALAAKVSDYRKAHGMGDSAVADAALIDSLNLGPTHYLDIIDVNAVRAGEIPGNPGDRFILVDAAEQMLYMYDGQTVSGSMRVVVGKESDPTPIMAAMISFSEVNPYWNVPPDLTRDRYAARVLRGGKSYLDSRGFEALDGWDDDARVLGHGEVDWRAVQRGDVTLRLRQKPGPSNGMGAIKFMMPNRLGIYLHDSPSRELFDESHRAFSAGCVRLHYAWELADWVYGNRSAVSTKEPAAIVELDQHLPVYITYFTAVPSEHGFEFRNDFYNRDRPTIAKLAADRQYQRELEAYEEYQRQLREYEQQQQQVQQTALAN